MLVYDITIFFILDLSDTDECVKNSHSCNTTTSYCVDVEGDFRCACNPGYTQGTDSKLCVGTLFLSIMTGVFRT